MTDKDLADKLDVEKRLKDHGCKKAVCGGCNRSGHNPNQNQWQKDYGIWQCPECGGKGHIWEVPA